MTYTENEVVEDDEAEQETPEVSVADEGAENASKGTVELLYSVTSSSIRCRGIVMLMVRLIIPYCTCNSVLYIFL